MDVIRKLLSTTPLLSPDPLLEFIVQMDAGGRLERGQCIKADINQKTHDHYVESPS